MERRGTVTCRAKATKPGTVIKEPEAWDRSLEAWESDQSKGWGQSLANGGRNEAWDKGWKGWGQSLSNGAKGWGQSLSNGEGWGQSLSDGKAKAGDQGGKAGDSKAKAGDSHFPIKARPIKAGDSHLPMADERLVRGWGESLAQRLGTVTFRSTQTWANREGAAVQAVLACENDGGARFSRAYGAE